MENNHKHPYSSSTGSRSEAFNGASSVHHNRNLRVSSLEHERDQHSFAYDRDDNWRSSSQNGYDNRSQSTNVEFGGSSSRGSGPSFRDGQNSYDHRSLSSSNVDYGGSSLRGPAGPSFRDYGSQMPGCSSNERKAELARHKETVREMFLRQVRSDSRDAIPTMELKVQKSSKKPTATPNTRKSPTLHPRMDLHADAEVPTLQNIKLGKINPIKPESRRDTLTDQLSKCTYECMVCCGKIYHRQSIWNCQSCHNAFHLHCIKKWSDSSAIQSEWRCPGCQNIVNYYPKFYYCYCGKMKNPPFSSSGMPHSCGNSCGKKKSSREDCSHLCGLQCHPGPCENCTDMVNRKCSCGKSEAFVQCQSKTAVLCGNVCGKLLNCEVHECKLLCHAGSCEECVKIVILRCHCGRHAKDLLCTTEANEHNLPKYSCKVACDNLLNCKNHRCTNLCHPNHCDPCQTSVDVVVSCPCGQTSIAESCRKNNQPLRSSCFDAIPSCGKICNKILNCGPFDEERHRCTSKCHSELKCPCVCPLVTVTPCRCSGQHIEIPCAEYVSGADPMCQRKCNKKRSCGRHKCNQKCCIDPHHICTIVCGKPLSCGNHHCESLCHYGHCRLCPNVSFDELRCECGEAVLYPPVPCGAPPPACEKPCLRQHECDHPVHHQCHSEPNCPPCPFLTEKWCYGKHELRKNIPCYNNNVSCGMRCVKELSCGRHNCPRTCHAGDCEVQGEACKLQCTSRIKCGHACSAPCHEGSCQEVICRKLTEVQCRCGRRKEVILCWKRAIEFEQVISEAVSHELNEMFKNEGKAAENEPTVEELTETLRATKDITVVYEELSAIHFANSLEIFSTRLKCDKECGRVERMRKIAEALQLHNPDPETRVGPPNYSDFLKKFAQKSPQFVENVHEKLTLLVMQTKKSTKKNNTYGFDSMNREKRTVIHEYSDHFGCQSESFDEEPNRNVIVTASKDKCWLPSVSLIDVVFGKSVVNKTERRNVYQDLELSEPPKTKILGPANKFKFK